MFSLIFLPKMGFLGGPDGKQPACQCRRHKWHGSLPGLGRSLGEGNGNPLQYACLENLMEGGVCGRLQSMGLQGIKQDRATSLSLLLSRLILNVRTHSLYSGFSLYAIPSVLPLHTEKLYIRGINDFPRFNFRNIYIYNRTTLLCVHVLFLKY